MISLLLNTKKILSTKIPGAQFGIQIPDAAGAGTFGDQQLIGINAGEEVLSRTNPRNSRNTNLGGGDDYEILSILFTGNIDTLRGDEDSGDNITNKYRIRIAK